MPTLTPNQKNPKEAPKKEVKVKAPTLSARLIAELPRTAGQFIKATHVYGDFYRVNWFTHESKRPKKGVIGAKQTQDIGFDMFYISDSQFLKATVDEANKLVVEDKSISRTEKPKDLLALML